MRSRSRSDTERPGSGEGGLVLEPEAAARRVIHRLSGQELVAEERGAHGLHGFRRYQVDPGDGGGVGDYVVGNRKTGDARPGDGQRVELVRDDLEYRAKSWSLPLK